MTCDRDPAHYVREVFEKTGDYFDPDPHQEGGVLVIFTNPPDDLAECLRELGIGFLDTTDEGGTNKYIVIYEEGDLTAFLKKVAPPLPEVEPLLMKLKRYVGGPHS
ncbi:hypothetical protein [Thermoproteus tenax]|uniref:Uncharacterized protein n=1 Tax=Thermoproteus tenax (strain ATCC 35583 / DSM 2078 / JCM 9277 / NBRC 100435 / Kra 1) TaxID=768679 RepID=G4RP70_THETK|nr:hypothetical protein [Thermoproteus tenax]CCC81365.1 conserved hypothetical protein [Thermoproteus tenax Kra 1]